MGWTVRVVKDGPQEAVELTVREARGLSSGRSHPAIPELRRYGGRAGQSISHFPPLSFLIPPLVSSTGGPYMSNAWASPWSD